MSKKILFYNGEIITADKNDTVCEALLIEDNKIIYAGSINKAKCLAKGEAEEIDLCGSAVLPGFIDCHIHMAVAEAKSETQVGVTQKDGVNTIADLLEKLGNVAKTKKIGEWIVGSGYNHELLAENRHITADELDNAVPDNPVMLVHVSGHLSICNSKAFALAKDSGLQLPSEHTIKTTDGKLTGLVKETAHFMMLKNSPILPSDEALVAGIQGFTQKLLKKGITSVHDAGGYGEATFRTLQKAKQSGALGCRTYTMLWTLFGKDAQKENAKTMISSGFHTGFGDNMLKKGPLKIMVDGSAVGGTCATSTLIVGSNKLFPTTFEQKELDEIFITAHKAGFQLTAHAAGDKAIDMVLNSYEKAMSMYPRHNPRHRIEHCFLCTEEQIKRIKALGIIPIPNPGFLSVWGGVFEKYYGDREECLIPLKSFEKMGVMTPFGSDAMVIDEYSPLFGIAAAMERRDHSTGAVISPDQSINLMRAIKCYTAFGAYASFEEDIKGSLECGKLADLVVLSDSIVGKTPDEIRKLRVCATYLGGRKV
ncbi:MAG: amidohydrolase [Ruminococcaceae bacterium]|nr:amidohydrolase [Oscillospiraceae bacterium]